MAGLVKSKCSHQTAIVWLGSGRGALPGTSTCDSKRGDVVSAGFGGPAPGWPYGPRSSLRRGAAGFAAAPGFACGLADARGEGDGVGDGCASADGATASAAAMPNARRLEPMSSL